MSVRQISIGGFAVGIIGLNEIFAEVKASGENDEAKLRSLIFEKVRAGNYVAPGQEEAYLTDLYDEFQVYTGQQPSRTRQSGVTEVRVYGADCQRCKMLDRMILAVLTDKGLTVDYQYITDVREIAAAGILGSPALTINGRIAFLGKVPTRGQLEKKLLAAVTDKTL